MTTEDYLVSILVPVYNVEKYIERCASSLFRQTYFNLEYIFVDDCSPDSSIRILMKLQEDYPQRQSQINIIHHQRNRGLSAARNTAIKHASGEFVIFVDSDDYLEIDAIEKLVMKQKATMADIVTGQAIQHTSDSCFVMERPQFNHKDSFINDMIELTLHHTIWGRLIKRSLYTINQIQAKEGVNFGEDLQVMAQLAFYCEKFVSINDVIYHYDNTNMNSYMNSYDGHKYMARLLQDKASIMIVLRFYENADKRFLPKIAQSLKMIIFRLMEESCRRGDKEMYNSFRLELKGLNVDKYSFKERIYKFNYYLCRLLSQTITKLR